MELDVEDTNSGVLENWSAERLSRASYKDLGTPQEVESRFLRHLMSSSTCQSSLRVLLTSTSTTTRDYSLEIDAFDLLQDDPILGHMLLKFPGTLLKLLENAIVAAQKEIQRQILMENEDRGIDSTSATSKPIVKGDKGDSRNGFPPTRVHARLVHLPPTCCKMSLASMQASDVGKIVQCSGTVVRTSPVCMYEVGPEIDCYRLWRQVLISSAHSLNDWLKSLSRVVGPTDVQGKRDVGKPFISMLILNSATILLLRLNVAKAGNRVKATASISWKVVQSIPIIKKSSFKRQLHNLEGPMSLARYLSSFSMT